METPTFTPVPEDELSERFAEGRVQDPEVAVPADIDQENIYRSDERLESEDY